MNPFSGVERLCGTASSLRPYPRRRSASVADGTAVDSNAVGRRHTDARWHGRGSERAAVRRHVAVATAVTIVALAGCAQPGMPAAAPVGVNAPAMLSAVIDQVYGTPQHRQAGEERMWLTSQSAIATCARTKGVVYGVTPYQPMRPPTAPAPGDLLGFAPQRANFGVATRIEMLAKRGETPNPGLPAASDDQARWFTAVESCQDAATAGEKLRAPEGQQELEVELVDLLGHVQQQVAPDLTRQYATCMKSAGIDAGDLSEAYLKVEQKFPPVSFERPSDPTAPRMGRRRRIRERGGRRRLVLP